MPIRGFNDPIIWTTTCFHGGQVSLYEEEWQHHILTGHPEMKGLEELVKKAVEDPLHVREGEYPDSRAFEIESATNPDGIRAFVRYDSEMFVDGGVDGIVTTAYPINKKIPSRVGRIIYTRPTSRGGEK